MQGPGLVAWGGGPVAGARERQRDGARVVSWPAADVAPLRAAGLAFETAENLLGPTAMAACAAAGRSWARVWARLPLQESRSFRDLAGWRGESLLWTCEAFLAGAGAGARCAAAAELCLRVLDATRPSEVDACGLGESDSLLLARAATASRVLFHGQPHAARPLSVGCTPATRRQASLLRRLVPSHPKAPLAQAPLPLVAIADPEHEGRIVDLVAAARDPGTGEPLVIGSDELARFESPRARREAANAVSRLRELHAALAGTPALVASYAHRGVAFDDLAAGDLAALLLQRLPGTLPRLERTAELLEATRPGLLLVAVEDVDERRSYGLAARACGVPWAVLRLAALRGGETERADGGPQPLATLASDGDGAAGALAALRATACRKAGTA